MANVQDIKAKEAQLKKQWAVITQGVKQSTPTNSKQIWSAWADTGAWAVAWIQPIPTIQQQQTTPTVTKQAGQAQVGTWAVAGMPNQTPNYYQMANQAQTAAEITKLRAWASKNTNNQPAPVATTPTATAAPAKSNVKTWWVAAPVEQDWRAWLKNADINLSQYWDDSSEKNYNNQDLWWGENQKYTGEGVKTSNVAYDPNATIAWLDPNYKYGKDAQLANSDSAWYIARRNDTIASALYNEGKTSREDVANFLYSQSWFTNSNANERENTIDSIYKRLGQMAAENPKNEEKATESNKSTQSTTNNPGMELSDDGIRGGDLYWKVTADNGIPSEGIHLEADMNAIQNTINMARQNNYKALQKMNSHDIAVSMAYGTDPYGSQAIADLATFDPQKYQEIQQELKNIQSMEDVNNIAQGEGVKKVAQTDEGVNTINNSIEDWAKSNSTDRSYQDTVDILTDKLSNSQTATTATQEMLNINKDIAEIEEKMRKLPQEARKAFKGDVPQYIVDAYVANRTAQYQSDLNKLQSRYNSAIDLYKTEVAQQQWSVEMNLKQLQFEADRNQQLWDRAYKTKQLGLQQQQQAWNQMYNMKKLSFDSIKNIGWTDYYMDENWNWVQLDNAVAKQAYQADVQQKMQTYLSLYADGTVGGQCESFTDNFTEATTGLRMEWANGWATTAKEKEAYVNSWIPEVGSVAVFDYWIKDSNWVDWWHTMLVAWYDPTTGIVTLKWSNKSKKEWEYERVYTQQVKLSDLQNSASWKWFWDPYQDLQYQGLTQSQGLFFKANTPMTTTIDKLLSNASTAGERTTVSNAEFMYDKLYALKNEGYIDKLVEAWAMEDFINGIDRSKFGKQWDENGSEFLNQLWKYIRNKVKDEEVHHAFNELYQMVEKKLRSESGAAISSSERAMDFQLFLPEPGQSAKAREDKLKAWDEIIFKDLRSAWLKSSDYIPVFWYTQAREIW